MKKFLSLLLAVCLISAFPVSNISAEQETQNAIVMYVDSSLAMVNNEGKYIDEDKSVSPVVENGRTLVPVRFIAENLKMNVDYNEKDEIATISNDNCNINFTIGSNIMSVNGEEKLIDKDNDKIVAKTANGRTLIPMRSFVEAIGKKVFYDRGLIIVSDKDDIYNPESDKAILDELIAKVNVLPTVGSKEYLTELVGSIDGGIRYYIKGESGGGSKALFEDAMPAPSAAPSPSAAESDSMQNKSDEGIGYSQTNTQVKGVDEADTVKTDGEYLYQVNNQRILITKISPASQMSITSVITRENEQFQPNEIYIDGNKLVIFAGVYKYDEPKVYDSAKSIRYDPSYDSGYYTQCSVYDIADKTAPKLERTLEVEGNYLSSRKIGNIVYLVANKYLRYYYQPQPLKDFAATYTDNNTSVNIGYDKVHYFPGFTNANYLIIASIDITKPDQGAVVETMLGGGENIYVSKGNMYVAMSNYNNEKNMAITNIFKFSLNNGNITYLKKGEVDGNILNQFSMDEYDGKLRIATTVYSNRQYNNLYILDDTLNLCGSIEDIAPGERIYSTRFVGGRGYMVTFRQVDPLFVMDLADANNPRILGNLKIPGYSDYIHPIDDNHIIGFGKDATNDGLYQGMKMAMFDVSDVQNPKQKFMEIIGDRGTESALLNNHKALLYAPEKNLLAFPVTVRETDKNDPYNNSYGQLTFSGAYVYNFDTENGFKLKGRISHLTDNDMLKLGNYVDANKEISRILYAADSLITTSNAKIQAHSIDTMQYQNGIVIPE